MKKKSKVTEENLYSDGMWYLNTYESLGYYWLLDSINKLIADGLIENNYVLLSLSANAAFYEWETYFIHSSNYNPKYYVSDINASKLKDKKRKSQADFMYLKGDNDAATISNSLFLEKADIILDCKGALWYALNEYNIEDVKKLIEKYISLLKNDNSILLIDYYKLNPIFYVIWKIKYFYKKYNESHVTFKMFGELSTYKYFKSFFGIIKTTIYLKRVKIKKYRDGYPLTKYMDTAYLTKKDLEKLSVGIDKIPRLQIIWLKRKWYLIKKGGQNENISYRS